MYIFIKIRIQEPWCDAQVNAILSEVNIAQDNVEKYIKYKATSSQFTNNTKLEPGGIKILFMFVILIIKYILLEAAPQASKGFLHFLFPFS